MCVRWHTINCVFTQVTLPSVSSDFSSTYYKNVTPTLNQRNTPIPNCFAFTSFKASPHVELADFAARYIFEVSMEIAVFWLCTTNASGDNYSAHFFWKFSKGFSGHPVYCDLYSQFCLCYKYVYRLALVYNCTLVYRCRLSVQFPMSY